jgi:TonB family protein
MKRSEGWSPSILKIAGIIVTVSVLCLSALFSTQIFAANLPEALNSIPSDYQFISGINVRRLVDNSLHSELSKDQQAAGQMAGKLSSFGEEFGVDFNRDISYLVMAVRSGKFPNPEGLQIVSGDFDRNRILSFIRSKPGLSEMEYAGATILLTPNKTDPDGKNAIVFLNEREIAFGNLESIKAALETKAETRKNILANSEMASLINSISLNEVFWFAGDAASVFRQSPLPTPPVFRSMSIQNVVGSFNIMDNVFGKITATVPDSGAASKLADVLEGIIALRQLPPDLQLLLSKMTVSQNATQVSISLEVPGDLLKRLGGLGSLPILAGGTPPQSAVPADGVYEKAPGLKPPRPLALPMPPYTDEARRANVEGTVVLQMIVRKDGTTDSFKVLKGLGYGLDESAINTIAKKWRFQPGTLNGTPINVRISIETTFRLFTRPQRMPWDPIM